MATYGRNPHSISITKPFQSFVERITLWKGWIAYFIILIIAYLIIIIILGIGVIAYYKLYTYSGGMHTDIYSFELTTLKSKIEGISFNEHEYGFRSGKEEAFKDIPEGDYGRINKKTIALRKEEESSSTSSAAALVVSSKGGFSI
ncbi:hypothetical protein Salmi_Mp130 (mitochondrion) [Salvia miltiorrhiza]|uniref:Uncharacterized protein n=1 Tax=Salvia miltiorrhiza TaxID=226208 RepID=V9P5E6_SALMI|nr:hypothetical protein Salmi_Mp130 [Salvia miltiorrhiza]AGU16658.1 hypothetical protein Salmi_Mp130 [Salvia miltiorrhiza]